MAEAYGRTDAAPRPRSREVVRHIVNAPNCALPAASPSTWLGIRRPARLVSRPFEILGAATLPLTMLYAGLMIEVRGLNRLWPEMSYTVVVKLGLSALIGAAIASLLRFSGDVFNTIVIMAAMPTAMMSLVIGARSGLRSDVLAGAVVVTTLLATLTLPAVAGGPAVSGCGERLAAAVAARASQVVLGPRPRSGARAGRRRGRAGVLPSRHRRGRAGLRGGQDPAGHASSASAPPAGRRSSGSPPPRPTPTCW